MQIQYNVHRVSTHPAEAEVEYKGQTVTAKLSELEVELFNDEQHGSLTLRFRNPDEVVSAKEVFVAGEDVVLSFAKAGTPATEAPAT